MNAARARTGVLSVLFLGCTAAPNTPPVAPTPEKTAQTATHAPDTATAESGHSRPASLQEQLNLRQLMRAASRIRGLTFRAPIAMHVEDAKGMRAYVRRALDDSEITRATRRYVALGLIPRELDVRAVLEGLLEQELVGYYDPVSKRLVVRDELMAALGRPSADPTGLALRETIVHELVHALQDQQLGLADQLHAERTTDAENAYAAVVEGDAQLTMLAYALEQRGSSLDRAIADDPSLEAITGGGGLHLSAAMRDAPALVREPLLFRYREGAQYAAKLYRIGGFSRINAAHAAPPLSTAAIVAPAPRPPIEPAFDVDPPGHRCTADSGFAQVDADTLGALELAIVTSEDPASRASIMPHVLADRYALFADATSVASVWLIRMDGTALAQRVARSFTVAASPNDVRRFVFHRDARVLVVRGLPESCATAIADGARFSRVP